MATIFEEWNYDPSGVSEDEMERLVLRFVGDHKVVMFSKQPCEYCWIAKNILDLSAQPYRDIDLGLHSDGPMIQRVLKKITGKSTVPRIFIRGKCIGGCKQLQKLYSFNKLYKILNKPENPQRDFHGSYHEITEKDVGD